MSENESITRRTVLAGAAVAGSLVLLGEGVFFVAANVARAEGEEGETGEQIEDTQYGFLVNSSRCQACNKCVEACRRYNKTPEETPSRRWIVEYTNEYGKLVRFSTGCMHCAKPACMTVCPAGAITKRADGIVVVNDDRCIGCKYCYQACPYGVPHYTSVAMDKCDCCLGCGVPAGHTPHCAESCSFGALKFGRFDELLASTGGTAMQVQGSTEPSYLIR